MIIYHWNRKIHYILLVGAILFFVIGINKHLNSDSASKGLKPIDLKSRIYKKQSFLNTEFNKDPCAYIMENYLELDEKKASMMIGDCQKKLHCKINWYADEYHAEQSFISNQLNKSYMSKRLSFKYERQLRNRYISGVYQKKSRDRINEFKSKFNNMSHRDIAKQLELIDRAEIWLTSHNTSQISDITDFYKHVKKNKERAFYQLKLLLTSDLKSKTCQHKPIINRAIPLVMLRPELSQYLKEWKQQCHIN